MTGIARKTPRGGPGGGGGLQRRQLAKLPFEKKIEIIVELQKAAAAIRKDPRHVIWPR